MVVGSQKQGGCFQSLLHLFSPPWWLPSLVPHQRWGLGCTWYQGGVGEGKVGEVGGLGERGVGEGGGCEGGEGGIRGGGGGGPEGVIGGGKVFEGGGEEE